MSSKQILLVDDQASDLRVLQVCLEGLNYQVFTATDGFTALDQLYEREFDLIVTDCYMADMDGLELLEAIRYIQPTARVIMVTAYGNEALEAEARRLKAYYYLTKPLGMKAFRQAVQEALGHLGANRPGILVLSDERYRQVNRLLEKLRAEVSARCLFLTDIDGRTIAQIGNTDKFPIEQIASLLGGGIATLLEAGRAIDGDTNTVHLAYREGKQEDIYAINVGQHLLLILVINRGPYSSRLGSVWYYAQQTTVTLSQTISEAEYIQPQEVFSETVSQAFDTELDNLFVENGVG